MIWAPKRGARMRNFYCNYRDNEKLAPLVQEIGRSHNLAILDKCKHDLQRELPLPNQIARLLESMD